jgi:hypothetical protein
MRSAGPRATSRAIAIRSAPVHQVPGAASDCHARFCEATMSRATATPVPR